MMGESFRLHTVRLWRANKNLKELSFSTQRNLVRSIEQQDAQITKKHNSCQHERP
jgi:hypothetical protein